MYSRGRPPTPAASARRRGPRGLGTLVYSESPTKSMPLRPRRRWAAGSVSGDNAGALWALARTGPHLGPRRRQRQRRRRRRRGPTCGRRKSGARGGACGSEPRASQETRTPPAAPRPPRRRQRSISDPQGAARRSARCMTHTSTAATTIADGAAVPVWRTIYARPAPRAHPQSRPHRRPASERCGRCGPTHRGVQGRRARLLQP